MITIKLVVWQAVLLAWKVVPSIRHARDLR
jgi:hypothetical protein